MIVKTRWVTWCRRPSSFPEKRPRGRIRIPIVEEEYLLWRPEKVMENDRLGTNGFKTQPQTLRNVIRKELVQWHAKGIVLTWDCLCTREYRLLWVDLFVYPLDGTSIVTIDSKKSHFQLSGLSPSVTTRHVLGPNLSSPCFSLSHRGNSSTDWSTSVVRVCLIVKFRHSTTFGSFPVPVLTMFRHYSESDSRIIKGRTASVSD